MEEVKICTKCNIPKPLSRFTKDCRYSPPRLRTLCKDCANKANQASIAKNREEHNRKIRERRNKRKQRAIEYKGGVCGICGGVFHTAAFDFHHLDPLEKDKDPGLMLGLIDEKLFKELDKCQLLCSNCHRILHYEQINPRTT